MCLAIPGKVLEIDASSQPLMGKISFGGAKKEICLELVPDIRVGEYVVVHVGFAISKMDEAEAIENLQMLAEMGELADEEERERRKEDPQ